MSQIGKEAFGEWYLLAVATGLALCLAALAADHHPLLLIGLGLVFIGIGEFINHPFCTEIVPDPFRLGALHIKGRPRRNKVAGWALVLIGLSLGGLGLWKVALL